MTFDILHYVLLTAERAVKIMKQQQKDEEEDEMMHALEGTSIRGHVPPDPADGNFTAVKIMQFPSKIFKRFGSQTLMEIICHLWLYLHCLNFVFPTIF